MNMSNISPCNKICKLNEDDICIGCFRTREEISNWTKYNDTEKQEVIRRIDLRKNKDNFYNFYN